MAAISHSLLCWALVFLCVAQLCFNPVEAGRKNKGRRKSRDKPCKYRGEKSECDLVTNTRNMTLTLKKGNPEQCPETKVVSLSCKKLEGCKYEAKMAQWSECDPHTNRRVLVKPLAEGSPESCPQTHTRVRRCKKGKKRGGRGGRSGRKKKGRKNKNRKNKNGGERRRYRKNKKVKVTVTSA